MRGQWMCIAVGLALVPRVASPQVPAASGSTSVGLAAAVASTLSVSVNSGASLNIASLTDGVVNPFPGSVSITTRWDLHPSTANVVLVGYFAMPNAALANGTSLLPSSRVQGRLGTTAAFAPFSGAGVVGGSNTVGVAGGALQLFVQTVLGINRVGARTDDLYLQLDLAGMTTVSGTYTGTLTLRAITQ